MMFNPQQMKQMMKQLGIKSRELDVEELVMKTSAGEIVLKNPQVLEMDMKGQKVYQVSGGERVEKAFNDEDVELVAEQAHISKELAVELLKKADGDIAQAIVLAEGLSEEESKGASDSSEGV